MTTLRNVLGWSRHSSFLLSGFLLTCLLIAYIWWPLVEEYLAYIDGSLPWYRYVDWLLIGIFLLMSLAIMARANLKVDTWIILIGMGGGFFIESWGTQTNLWFYYTAERPPLWIIPAWPIASLSIDRLTRLLDWSTQKIEFLLQSYLLNKTERLISFKFGYRLLYWLTFISFYALMLDYISPTFRQSFTIAALLLTALIILTSSDHKTAWLVFMAGSGLGYFLELWGTTRLCWIYYTFETPPIFAVFAHGMAAVGFWWVGLLPQRLFQLQREQ